MSENIKNRHLLINCLICLGFFSENSGPQTEFVRKISLGRGVCFGRSHIIKINSVESMMQSMPGHFPTVGLFNNDVFVWGGVSWKKQIRPGSIPPLQ
jgi:hypothetical protein